jgi:hypothetical protein
MRRIAATGIAAVLLAACSSQATPTALATPSQTAEATVSATPSPSPTPQPTAEPTAGPSDVPQFATGATVVTNAPGLRVRSRPGTQQRVVASLGLDAQLLVGMGPVFIEGLGWYLVRDADPADPAFVDGWVAAGFEPDPFLVSSSFGVADNPYLGGYANDASGEYGPVLLSDAQVSITWAAVPLGSDGCSFAVDLQPGSGSTITAIRSTVGQYPAFGDLYSQFFDEHPELHGDIFVSVTSDCSWALAFVHNPPPATPSPTPEG